jgi:hypothetical protein
LKAATERANPDVDSEEQLCFAPVKKGVQVVGSIGIAGGVLSRDTLDAIGDLTAKALDPANTSSIEHWSNHLTESASELN